MTEHDPEFRLRQAEDMIEVLSGELLAHRTVLAALIAKHNDHDQLKLLLTSTSESLLTGPFAAKFSDRAQQSFRAATEALLGVDAVTGSIDPLRQALRPRAD